jgi:hypothetical protein
MRSQIYIIFLLAVSGMYGCIFAPGLSEEAQDQSNIITAQEQPWEVLANFRYAYKFADSLIYSDVLDSNFIFISKNYATSPPTEIIWGRDVDIKTTMGMFRHFNVLELTWRDGWDDPENYDFVDSTRTNVKTIVTFQLTLDGGREVPTIKGEAFFEFAPRKRNIWRLVRWEDKSSF